MWRYNSSLYTWFVHVLESLDEFPIHSVLVSYVRQNWQMAFFAETCQILRYRAIANAVLLLFGKLFVPDTRYNARLWSGSIRGWAARRAESWRRTFGPEEVRLPADDWSVCTLMERDRVGGKVLRYRFRLQV